MAKSNSDNYDTILLMKIGPQGDETLDDIINRKNREEDLLGYSYWGYGGTLCHPLRVVQPFAQGAQRNNKVVKVLFVITGSPFDGRHIPEAKECSSNKLIWNTIPSGTRITVSKYALVIRNLHKCSFDLPLAEYKVAIGPSAGRSLSDYFHFRVDKAVAHRINNFKGNSVKVPVAFMADLVEPYAVFLQH